MSEVIELVELISLQPTFIMTFFKDRYTYVFIAAVHGIICMSQPNQYSQDFKTITEYEACRLLVDSVKKSWKPLEKNLYYRSSFTPGSNLVRSVSFPCMTALKRTDAEILFGVPHISGKDYGLYRTSRPYKGSLSDSYAKIYYSRSQLVRIVEYTCPGTTNFVRRNFAYDKKSKLYRSALIPMQFGLDSVRKECLNVLAKSDFVAVFGKPTVLFEGRTLQGMQKIQWDEKGNEVRPDPRDSRFYRLRYLADTIGISKNSGFEITVWPDPDPASFVVYNCQGSFDTIRKKWKYNEKDQFFESRLHWEEIELISKCLFGTEKEMILKLFGPPSKATETVLEYNLQKFPGPPNLVEPDRIVIYLSRNGRLETLGHEGGSVTYSSH